MIEMDIIKKKHWWRFNASASKWAGVRRRPTFKHYLLLRCCKCPVVLFLMAPHVYMTKLQLGFNRFFFSSPSVFSLLLARIQKCKFNVFFAFVLVLIILIIICFVFFLFFSFNFAPHHLVLFNFLYQTWSLFF